MGNTWKTKTTSNVVNAWFYDENTNRTVEDFKIHVQSVWETSEDQSG